MITSGLAAMASAWLTRTGLRYTWNATTGEDPPMNPASTSTAWTEAITWTVAASVVAGLTRLVTRRAVASTLGGPVPDDQYDV
ncbi:MAG: hypothetical protein Rubg2KO_31310 [Rubricoccaceae bacterium]